MNIEVNCPFLDIVDINLGDSSDDIGKKILTYIVRAEKVAFNLDKMEHNCITTQEVVEAIMNICVIKFEEIDYLRILSNYFESSYYTFSYLDTLMIAKDNQKVKFIVACREGFVVDKNKCYSVSELNKLVATKNIVIVNEEFSHETLPYGIKGEPHYYFPIHQIQKCVYSNSPFYEYTLKYIKEEIKPRYLKKYLCEYLYHLKDEILFVFNQSMDKETNHPVYVKRIDELINRYN